MVGRWYEHVSGRSVNFIRVQEGDCTGEASGASSACGARLSSISSRP